MISEMVEYALGASSVEHPGAVISGSVSVMMGFTVSTTCTKSVLEAVHIPSEYWTV